MQNIRKKQIMSEEKSTQIIEHKSPLKHIRIRPGMYVGQVANTIHLLTEAYNNADDEVVNGFADTVWITFHKDGSYSVRDNGRGMPVDVTELDGKKMPMARMAWSVPNSGSHFGLDTTISAGSNGIGTKAINALSDKMVCRIWKNGLVYHEGFMYDQTLEEPGIPTEKLKEDGSYQGHRQTNENTPDFDNGFTHGTEIRWYPSDDVFETTKLNWDTVLTRLHNNSYLTHAHYILHNEYTDQTVEFHETDGVQAFVEDLIKKSEGTPITKVHKIKGVYEKDNVKIKAEIALAWTNGPSITELAFTNTTVNSQQGTHVDGFNQGISRLINLYNKNLNISNNTIEARDLRPGLIAVINLFHSNPMYSSQTKEQLTSSDAKAAINQIIYNNGQLEFDKYIKEIEAVIKQAKTRAEERIRFSDLSQIKLNKKEMQTKLSQKLKPAKKTGPKVHAELYIVEGDSAAGSLTRTRINDKTSELYQAIMPVRGKVISAMKRPAKDIFANEELATITAALGAGIGSKFDPTKLEYEKVIIATDADEDGDNIQLLLLSFFAKYMRPLIEQGHVYRILPPLFKNKLKNGKEILTYRQQEQDDFIERTKDTDIVSIDRNKGLGEMGDELTKETLIVPGSRRLLQLTTEDFEQSYELLNLYMGKDVEPRRKIIMEEAEFANIEE